MSSTTTAGRLADSRRAARTSRSARRRNVAATASSALRYHVAAVVVSEPVKGARVDDVPAALAEHLRRPARCVPFSCGPALFVACPSSRGERRRAISSRLRDRGWKVVSAELDVLLAVRAAGVAERAVARPAHHGRERVARRSARSPGVVLAGASGARHAGPAGRLGDPLAEAEDVVRCELRPELLLPGGSASFTA